MKTINPPSQQAGQKAILLFLLFCFSLVIAQPSNNVILGTISGKVIDKNLNQPIPYATIIINDGADKLISGGITTEDGTFSITDIPNGNYILKIQFIGYKSHSQPIEISKKSKNINVGPVSLEEEQQA